MDWDWKDIAWDSSELEPSNDSMGGQKNGAASVDLKLGETSDLIEKSTALKDPRDSETVSSPSRSSKRSRMQRIFAEFFCSVDGCTSDLSDCREYHRRHRVCEMHSKTPVVLVGGKQQRFCQQCSRFHSLGEFDEVKRSCRKRLEGHNRRRRKPQPPSLFMTSGKILSNYKGPRILQFGSPQTYANPLTASMWPATAKTGAEFMSYDWHRPLQRLDQQSLPSSFANVQHQQDKQLPFLQATGPKVGYGNEAVSGIPISQPISGAITPSSSGGKESRKFSSDCKPGSFDSGCALYLLSTLQTQSSELSLVQSSITCPMQSPLGDTHFDAVKKYSCSESPKEKATAPVLVLDANTSNLRCNGMLRMRPDGLVENGDSPTLPFFWE